MIARRVVVVTLVGAALVAGCPGTTRAGGPHLGHLGGGPETQNGGTGGVVEPGKPKGVEVVKEDRTIAVDLEDPSNAGKRAELGATLVRPRDGKGPAILIVPGAGDVSRNGTRPGDGVARYEKPVDVGMLWAEALAARGANVLVWDKRTCGPNDDPICKKNPQDDVDAEGPVALAKDVDAACALAKSEPTVDGRIVLFAHAQAADVALSSQCAKSAAAIVLVAPIPRAIDEVLVAGFKERAEIAQKSARYTKDPQAKDALLDEANQLKNLAGTREAELASIKQGRFASTARVQGATIAFWKGWMDLTGKTASLVEAIGAPKIVVLGEKDVQYAEGDRVRIRALAPDTFLEVKGADHHLLVDGKLLDSTVDVVGNALDKALEKRVEPQG